jgi:DnaK suppressor protein
MGNKDIQEIKEGLEKEKSALESNLGRFAKKDKTLKGDWDSDYPKFGTGVGNQALEEAADEVEEYSNLLPVEHSLELKLEKVNLALEKIEKGTYGICDKCGKKISAERLEVHPEANVCVKCEKK